MPHHSEQMTYVLKHFICLLVVCFLRPPISADESEITVEQRNFVQTSVLPLLEARCFQCHNGTKETKGGLVLTSRASALKGGDSGPAIIPGKPDQSLLIDAIQYEGFEMPPISKMPVAEISILVDWVKIGAPWPSHLQSADISVTAAEPFPLKERRDAHWAWQPIANPDPPEVKNPNWPSDSLDYFIAARLDTAELTPAKDADRVTLIRRLHFDLTGLIPTTNDVAAFVNDPADDETAIAAVADRLLDTPQYGERWARHWLDLVRYADTLGHEFDYPLPHAWQYRDYVIRAFNSDVPYDDFIREHIAGDLLPTPRRHPTEQYNESLIGTGFWFLHEAKHAPVDVEYEEAVKIDNQIDVFARTFLGLTVACARCHDHKFDAITTEDYYALYGVLQSSRRRTGWLDSGNEIAAISRQLKKLRKRADDITNQLRQQDQQTESGVQYLKAAIEVIHGQPDSDEQSESDIPNTRRSVGAVATEKACNPTLLAEWVNLLSHPDAQKVSNEYSLLARLAQISPKTSRNDIITQWQEDVTNAVSAETQTELYADFSHGLPDGWSTTGPAFAESARATVAAGNNRHRVATDGFSSNDLSHRFRGTLYSPTFEITHPEILIRIAGEGARLRLVIDGYVMAHFNKLLFSGTDQTVDTNGEFKWIRIAGDTHRYIGKHAYLEIMDANDGWFVIDEVRFVKQSGSLPPTSMAPSSRQLLTFLEQNSEADPILGVLNHTWPSLFSNNMLPSSFNKEWTELSAEWTALAEADASLIPVIAIADGPGEDQHVFIRGNHKNHGQVASRSFLDAIVGSDQAFAKSESGRRELMKHLLAQDNPLPARVAVNRIWHHLFGRGIVPSTDDFGVLGERPSHPQLLDHLATRFKQDGWSVKRLLRQLVLSRTYRMSSHSGTAANEQDPANTLLHSARIRRQQGEAIRDTMLRLAGHLDLTLFGQPVPVALTSFMQGRGRPQKSGPLDGEGRRSIYISVHRNFLSPFMLAFDTPAPVSTRGRRSVSNVPAQALIMLNNEFVQQQSQRWAKQLLSEDRDADSTIQRAYRQALSRLPTDGELTVVRTFAQKQAKQYKEPFDAEAIGPNTLADVCHAIMNTKEFVYIR